MVAWPNDEGKSAARRGRSVAWRGKEHDGLDAGCITRKGIES
jgi:hypothetical protein